MNREIVAASASVVLAEISLVVTWNWWCRGVTHESRVGLVEKKKTPRPVATTAKSLWIALFIWQYYLVCANKFRPGGHHHRVVDAVSTTLAVVAILSTVVLIISFVVVRFQGLGPKNPNSGPGLNAADFGLLKEYVDGVQLGIRRILLLGAYSDVFGHLIRSFRTRLGGIAGRVAADAVVRSGPLSSPPSRSS